MKGYQVVEPPELNPLLVNATYHTFAVAILTWLCKSLKLELRDYLDQVDIDVICVTCMGSYPAIGIHYKDPECDDVSVFVQTTISRLLLNKSVWELVGFIGEDKTDWQIATTNLMKR